MYSIQRDYDAMNKLDYRDFNGLDRLCKNFSIVAFLLQKKHKCT